MHAPLQCQTKYRGWEGGQESKKDDFYLLGICHSSIFCLSKMGAYWKFWNISPSLLAFLNTFRGLLYSREAYMIFRAFCVSICVSLYNLISASINYPCQLVSQFSRQKRSFLFVRKFVLVNRVAYILDFSLVLAFRVCLPFLYKIMVFQISLVPSRTHWV